MSEMVKRVAKAMCVASFGDDRSWLEWTDEARAAIEAMREPTQDMRHACWDLMEKNASVGNCQPGRIRGSGFPDVILSNMIDAALKP